MNLERFDELRQYCRDDEAFKILKQAYQQLEEQFTQQTTELANANASLQAEIADRQRTENALKQAEAKYRNIFEQAIDGIFQTTVDGQYLSANAALAKLYGYDSPADLMATLTDIEHQLYVDSSRRSEFIRLMQTRDPVSGFESQVYRQDGSIIWISENAYPVYSLTGELLFYEGSVTDITERKETQTALQRSEEALIRRERFLATLVNQLRQQAEQDHLLSAIALRIRQSLNLPEILHRTVDEIRESLGADRVLIYRFQRQHGMLVAASVLPTWEFQTQSEGHQIWYRDDQTPYDEGQSYVINDIERQPLSENYLQFMRQIGVKAKLVIPIMQGSQPMHREGQLVSDLDIDSSLAQTGNYLWGVLVVQQCSATRQWQPSEIDLLEKLAIQVAIAIQQAQLFDQVQQQAHRERLLNQLSHAVNSSLDANHILQEIVNRTGEGFGVDRVVMYTLDREIRAINEWCANPSIPSLLHFTSPLEDWPDLLDTSSAFNKNRAFYCLDLSQMPMTPARHYQSEQGNSRSVLSAPIFVHDRLYGALSLYTTTCYRSFTEEEIQFLHRIADQAAIALYNAHSYEHLEALVKQRTRELEQEKLVSEAASRAKSEFLATMSHELRTPLNAILGLSQILEREIFEQLSAKQKEYIQHIHSSGEHLLMLINDILDLAKVESGRETIAPTPLSVSEICNYCLTLVRQHAEEKSLQLLSQLDPLAQTCLADERRLKQMLLNLLSNAVKFTPAGTVALTVEKTMHGITFAVADTGIGIPSHKVPLLFQPFSQLDSQLSRQYAGTGLGLALTRKLARLHGGDVWVDAIASGGSRFTLYLPDLPAAPQ